MSHDIASLYGVFHQSAELHPERPAIEADGRVLSYAEVREAAERLATTLIAKRGSATEPSRPLTCVIGERSLGVFVGILGILGSGHGYVPIQPKFPPARVAWMIEKAGSSALVVDEAGARGLEEVLALIERPLTVLFASGPPDPALARAFPGHTFVAPAEFGASEDFELPESTPDDIAYVLFTSGSTGEPKGVAVAHRNIHRFLDVVCERYALGPQDRFSHVFDLTFDLSLFDLFAAWKSGGCLCCPNAMERMLPADYVVTAKLSIWFSVPSMALLLKQMRRLEPGVFPDLRLSLFCGEALPVALAQSWAEAAPGARLENIYGPTELTLACTHYRWHDQSARESVNEVVPIGEPYPQMRAKVVNDELVEVAPGQDGELIMAGPQVTLGYLDDPERTAKAFVVPPGESATFYRTGDRVRRPASPDQPLVFLGRVDHQVKIHGYRVELGEIEAALRREAEVDAAIAVGWPVTPSGAAGVVGFIDDPSVDTHAVVERMADRLPRYMVPKEIRVVDEFPLNVNGKIDRRALRDMLS